MSVYVPVYEDVVFENARLKLFYFAKSSVGIPADRDAYLIASKWKKNPSGRWSHPKYGRQITRRRAIKRQYARDENAPKPKFGRIKKVPDRICPRERMITIALESAEGRTALAQAMIEPIRTGLMYQNVGRRLLTVDERPEGALPRYEREAISSARHSIKAGRASKGETREELVEKYLCEMKDRGHLSLPCLPNEMKNRIARTVEMVEARRCESI